MTWDWFCDRFRDQKMSIESRPCCRTAWNEDTRRFLLTVPKIISTIESFHSAAEDGVMADFERLLLADRRLIGSRWKN